MTTHHRTGKGRKKGRQENFHHERRRKGRREKVSADCQRRPLSLPPPPCCLCKTRLLPLPSATAPFCGGSSFHSWGFFFFFFFQGVITPPISLVPIYRRSSANKGCEKSNKIPINCFNYSHPTTNVVVPLSH